MTTKATTNKFSSEMRERAMRMVLEHASEYPTRWVAVVSITAKIGCAAQTLHDELHGVVSAGARTSEMAGRTS